MKAYESTFTVLIVDDDEGHVELVRRNLSRIALGNPMVALHDGAQALDYIFRRGDYADRGGESLLILLDINMPGSVNGIEVLRQIKSDARTSRTPVIMLSTTDDPREISLCYELGCSVYITKPVDPLQFIEAIKRLGLFLQVIRLPEDNKEAEAAAKP
ncbi:MAG TPA: response regulator [Terracidiphilus sp.]|jgi:CheY-like chemotaxis protein